MGNLKIVLVATCYMLLASCAGLDIEGEVGPEVVEKFHEFKSKLSGSVGSARVRIAGARGFVIPGDTDKFDHVLEIVSQVSLLSASTDMEYKRPDVSIFLLWPNGETYASVSMIIDQDGLNRPEIFIHHGEWHFKVRSTGLHTLGRRWLDTGY